MKRLLVLIFLLMGLSACSNNSHTPDSTARGYFSTTTVTVDGKEIPCITWKRGNAGGLSCDWTAK